MPVCLKGTIIFLCNTVTLYEIIFFSIYKTLLPIYRREEAVICNRKTYKKRKKMIFLCGYVIRQIGLICTFSTIFFVACPCIRRATAVYIIFYFCFFFFGKIISYSVWSSTHKKINKSKIYTSQQD